MKKIKLALISCGLGHVQRGFEVSAARWKEALNNDPSIEARLFCGGQFSSGTTVANFPRNGFVANALKRFRLLHDGCRLEQLSLGVGLLKYLLEWKPEAIWLQEYSLAHLLVTWRKWFRLSYKIIFCDGAPVGPGLSCEFDFIQHLSPKSWQDGLIFGLPTEKMKVLPHCFPIPHPSRTRQATREKYGFNAKDWIIVCVAAWNRHHKRIDYLIEEVAAMNDLQVKLLLCGQPEAETLALKEMGATRLQNRITWLTVSPEEVANVLSASDLFVLPSLNEALGAVLIEAAMCSLPVITHPHPAAQYILQDEQWTVDLTVPGNLTRKLQDFRINPPAQVEIDRLHKQVLERFSDEALAPEFSAMIQHAVSLH